MQRLAFDRMTYDEKLAWCVRPEHVDGPSEDGWKAVNAHLGTQAASLPELVQALGERRFGRTPRVGDAFCGGGSVPFEAARLGCEAFGADLNPVAALLTWGALHIVGGGEKVAARVRAAQAEVFAAVDRQVTEWRIEHNEVGWRCRRFPLLHGDRLPRLPLACAAGPELGRRREDANRRAASAPNRGRNALPSTSGLASGREDLAAARAAATVKDSRLTCPNPACGADPPMAAIRGDRRDDGGRGFGLRLWANDDLVPRPDDVFQERLYCVRWRAPRLDALLEAEQHAARFSPVRRSRAGLGGRRSRDSLAGGAARRRRTP